MRNNAVPTTASINVKPRNDLDKVPFLGHGYFFAKKFLVFTSPGSQCPRKRTLSKSFRRFILNKNQEMTFTNEYIGEITATAKNPTPAPMTIMMAGSRMVDMSF